MLCGHVFRPAHSSNTRTNTPMRKALLLFALSILPAFAQAATVDSLKGLLNDTATAKGRFAQMVLDKNGKLLQQATGTMQFSRPGKFRWEYTKPYEQTI